MYKGKTFLAIIPARAGSKRLPQKNIMPLQGKPLIEWSIHSGIESKYIDTLCVSTDDKQTVEIAQKAGAEVPFLRPAELATDSASTMSVISHCVEFYKNTLKKSFDYVVLLQPTSPLRLPSDIDSAIDILFEKKCNAVVSLCETDHSPLWCNTLPEDLSMTGFLSEDVVNKRSQELPKYYRLNGAIYICETCKLLQEGTFYLKNNIYAYLMPRDRSIDIDDEIDFKLAEILLSRG